MLENRPSESIVTFFGLVWLAVVAVFSIENPAVIASVGAVIGGSGFLWSYLVDRKRAEDAPF